MLTLRTAAKGLFSGIYDEATGMHQRVTRCYAKASSSSDCRSRLGWREGAKRDERMQMHVKVHVGSGVQQGLNVKHIAVKVFEHDNVAASTRCSRGAISWELSVSGGSICLHR